MNTPKHKEFELTRRRQKAWRERREHMEGIRQRAIARAAEVRRENNAALVARLALLPAEISTPDLKAYIAGKYKGTFNSFCNRVRKHGMMTYDPFRGEYGMWVNLCRTLDK